MDRAKTDYVKMLRDRARQSAPREIQEEVASPLQQRNAEALAAWRRRWALRRPLPDTVAPWMRAHLNGYYELHRQLARAWLAARNLELAALETTSALKTLDEARPNVVNFPVKKP